MTLFYKINNGLAPSYLLDHIPERNEVSVNLRNRCEMAPLVRTEMYENSFFPYTIKAWKEQNDDAKFKPSVQIFKKNLTHFIRPLGHSLYLLVFQTYATTDLIII